MKIRIIMTGLAILVLLVSLTGCVYFNLDSSPTQLPTSTPSPINGEFVPPPTTSTEELPTIPDFVSVIQKIRPSVVAIDVTVPSIDVFGGVIPQEGAGSGWIIDESGLIVTNNHVVENASHISVTLEDGRSYQAVTVRGDSISDLAVLKINAPNLKAARVADSSKLRAGDWVLGMGYSLGQGISATKGIVSALDVTLAVSLTESLYGLIQTDAAINPGNSGGPLVNLLGEVVGITSVKVAQTGVEGTGFAIATREALPIVTDLVKSGYVIRPWMGITMYTVDQLVVLRYSLSVNRGVLVTRVVSGSPADKVGIQAGDVITSIDGKEVADVPEMSKILHGYQIGQQVMVTYYRGITANTVTVTLEASPPLST